MRQPVMIVIFLIVGACHGVGYGADLAGTNQTKQVYEAKCAKCHRFYDPQSYTDTQWSAWMAKMRRKAHLTAEQYDQLVRYLDSVRHPDAQSGARTNSLSPRPGYRREN
jgi:hypothetical protein